MLDLGCQVSIFLQLFLTPIWDCQNEIIHFNFQSDRVYTSIKKSQKGHAIFTCYETDFGVYHSLGEEIVSSL